MAKIQRTLGPAAFEAYMQFADSLKNGSNNDTIDRFKYRFAVKEGYIRPKRHAMTESAGGLSLGDFEKAFKGLVGAFLPHLDEDDQEILGRVVSNLDTKINGGDMAGAADLLKGALRDAGGDPDAFEDDDVVFEDDNVDDGGECSECDADSECGDGEECVDGKCVEKDGDDEETGKEDPKNLTEGKVKPLNDYGKNKFHPEDNCPNLNCFVNTKCNVDSLADPDNMYGENVDTMGVFDDDSSLYGELNFDDPYAPGGDNDWDMFGECQSKPNAAKPKVETIDTFTPGFGDDVTEQDLGPDYGDEVTTTFADNDRMPTSAMASDVDGFNEYDSESTGDSGVDYDRIADMILGDHGYENMAVGAGGVVPSNRRFTGV